MQLVDTREFAPKIVKDLSITAANALSVNNESDCKENNEQNKARTHLKLLVFRLQENMLLNDMFAEEFIASGGMEILINIIQDFNDYRNIQSYSLISLSRTMVYCNALNYLRQQTDIIEILFRFLKSNNVIIVRQALSMLAILTDFLYDGYNIMKNIAYKIANENINYVNPIQIINNNINNNIETDNIDDNNEYTNLRVSKLYEKNAVYSELVECLKHGDVDIKYNSLIFINLLLRKASILDKNEKKILAHSLAYVGVIDNLLVCLIY